MLNRFLNVRKLAPFTRSKPPNPTQQPQWESTQHTDNNSVLKIVHAGGIVECYYMAMPASSIMKKYPSSVLAKPDVFRRPWDSLVRSDDILTPGEKYYLVPLRTVKKLRRRIRKPNEEQVSANSFASKLQSLNVSRDGFTSKSFIKKGGGDYSSEVSGSLITSSIIKKNGIKKHVRFAGIDSKQKPGLGAIGKSKDESLAIVIVNNNSSNSKKKYSTNVRDSQEGKGNSKNGALWQPKLTAINES